MEAFEGTLVVRRSIEVGAPPGRTWQEFASFERMNAWWGALVGDPQGGQPMGQRLVAYEPSVGGRVEMQVTMDGEPANFGGRILVFDPGRELTFENDWLPNRGWLAPTRITIRLSPSAGGTVVELLHHGFERTGDDAASDHAAYEAGWGMMQLNALRAVIASSAGSPGDSPPSS